MNVYIHKLGCPKNDVDADYIMARLIDDGHVAAAEPSEADVIVVNTCCFIQAAKEESIEQILRLAEHKKSGRLKGLFVSGCFSQRHGAELLEGMPELDGAFGLGELDAIAKSVGEISTERPNLFTPAVRMDYLAGTRRHIADNLPYSYLKISDGCNRQCTYCIIPDIRGRFRSRRLDDIVREAHFLANHGKKELILVSQDSTVYGHDLKDGSNIVKLLKAIDQIDPVSWIRLMYLHPAQTDAALIDYLASPDNKTLPYFDLPFQHINSDILRRMKRQSTRDEIEMLVDRIRKVAPQAALRATFIVGFPGETEEQFEELCRFVQEREFDRVGAFTYSCESGSPAAEMPDQIEEEVKNRRLDQLMSLQREIAFDKNDFLIGKVVEVMLDSCGVSGSATGRTRKDCPDIDQEVRVTGDNLRVGEICKVQIEAADGYDLEGVKVEE